MLQVTSGRLVHLPTLCEELKEHPNAAPPPEWARIAINLPPAGNSGGVSFFDSDSESGLPGKLLSQFESDLDVGDNSLTLRPAKFSIDKKTVIL